MLENPAKNLFNTKDRAGGVRSRLSKQDFGVKLQLRSVQVERVEWRGGINIICSTVADCKVENGRDGGEKILRSTSQNHPTRFQCPPDSQSVG